MLQASVSSLQQVYPNSLSRILFFFSLRNSAVPCSIFTFSFPELPTTSPQLPFSISRYLRVTCVFSLYPEYVFKSGFPCFRPDLKNNVSGCKTLSLLFLNKFLEDMFCKLFVYFGMPWNRLLCSSYRILIQVVSSTMFYKNTP
jgi:hypothetical protein